MIFVIAAIPYYARRLLDRPLLSLVCGFGATWHSLVSDSQVRWVGPEKGVVHLALGAAVNAVWDLWAKVVGKPVWKLVSEMTPEKVVRCIPFRYIDDAVSPEEAVSMLREAETDKANRLQDALNDQAVPAYTTSAGWLGYGRDKMQMLLQDAVKRDIDTSN